MNPELSLFWLKGKKKKDSEEERETKGGREREKRKEKKKKEKRMGDDNLQLKARAQKIADLAGNRICFDCGRKDDIVFAATALGTFHCSECASLHRSVKAETGMKCFQVSRDRFVESDIEKLEKIGNVKGRQLYLSNPYPFLPVPDESEFRRSKRTLQKWIECIHNHHFLASPKVQGKIAQGIFNIKKILADHLWVKIMSYLDGVDLAHLSLVSRHFSQLTQLMWRHTYLKDYNLKYPHGTNTFAWKEWKEMYGKAYKAVQTIESFNGKKRWGFNISVPVYVNNEPTLLEEFVQQRKYVNVSTHNLTVKLQLNTIEFKKAAKGDVAVSGFIYLMDLRKKQKDEFLQEVRKYAGLGLACPTVMLGVIDENSEKVLSCETAQKITQDSGFNGFIPVGFSSTYRYSVYNSFSPSSPSSASSSQTADKSVSASQALKLAGEVLVEKLCQFGWPGVTIPPKWIPDNFASECMRCSKKFSVTTRRHHCRRCGCLSCHKCAKHKFPIPHIKQYTGQQHLICRGCEEDLREIEKWHEDHPKK